MSEKTFPYSPATLEAHQPDGSIYTEILDTFSWKEQSTGEWLGTRGLGYDTKFVSLKEINDELRGRFEGTTPTGTRVVVRRYSEYDPIRMGISGIPWPKSVAQDQLIGESEMSLFALTDVNGDVASLLLDSPSAFYLRYDGQWILIPSPEALEDYDLVEVEDGALDMYDPADQSGRSVKITAMPVTPEDDFRVQVRYSGKENAEAAKPLLTEAVVASAAIPTIASARDIPAAIEFAADHPDFRWYVERRVKALGIEDKFPWNE